ncbi:MAG: hypothetical protein ABR577_18440 [Pyrinomonadaceae bacterium]
MLKPTAVHVFLGLLIAALMRMMWRWLNAKKIADPVGLTAISIALVALCYLLVVRARRSKD